MKKLHSKIRNIFGFTMIEVMIVLALAGLIIVIILLIIPQESSARRDHQRKTYANVVAEALEEYYKNNGKFPGCIKPDDPPGCNIDDAKRFLSVYMPEGKDPLTGVDYRSTSIADVSYGVGNTSGSAIYYYNDVPHNTMPLEGQVYIATAHWCYITKSDNDIGPPLASNGKDDNIADFAVVIYQEKGGYYCIDNYTQT